MNGADEDSWRLVDEKPTNKTYGEEPGFKRAWKGTWRSPYACANFVYVIYATLVIVVDLHFDTWDHDLINKFYIAAAVVHVVNAFMYIWVWRTEGYPYFHRVMIPEALNILEASLYMVTAMMYQHESYGADGDSLPAADDPVLKNVQRLEMGASCVELLAACGWATTWYMTYPRIPGRGWTFDDPDIWANLSIITPGVIYVVYNVQLQLNPYVYGDNFLFVYADKLYMANALMYFLCSMRDVGWFWFMPTAGSFPFGKQSKSINSVV